MRRSNINPFVRVGLYFSATMSIFFVILGLIMLFLSMSTFDMSIILQIVLICVASGVGSGVVFGFSLWLFSKYLSKKFKKNKEELSKTETIILDVAASRFVKVKNFKSKKKLNSSTDNPESKFKKGKIAVGGWLFFTEKELIFISHKYNLWYNHMFRIKIEDIISITVPTDKKYMSNYCTLKLVNGDEEKFAVDYKENIISQIADLLKCKVL